MKHLLWLVLSIAAPIFAQPTATNPYDTLKRSGWFAVSGGITGAITSEGQAVAAICKQTNAVATFQRLLREPGAAQQLYGLLGLHMLKAPEFKTALPSLLNSKLKVQTLTGCIAGEQDVAVVARQIQNQQWNLHSIATPVRKNAPARTEQ